MAKLIRVYDPSETERKINLNIPEDICPGLLEFMSELPYGKDTPLIRGVFYQWYLQHNEAGTLDEALNEALSGPGGMIATGRQSRREIPAPPVRKKRIPKQREVTARPGVSRTTSGGAITDVPTPALPDNQPSAPEENRLPSEQTANHRQSTDSGQQPEQSTLPAESVLTGAAPGNGSDPQAVVDQQTQEPAAPVSDVEAAPLSDQQPTPEQMAALNSMGDMFGG